MERLTLEEKVALLSGQDKWTLPAIPAMGVESIVMSDGAWSVSGAASCRETYCATIEKPCDVRCRASP